MQHTQDTQENKQFLIRYHLSTTYSDHTLDTNTQTTQRAIREEWRPIEGWPYQVSSFGRVRNDPPKPGTYLMGSNYAYYPMVMLSRSGEHRSFARHKLVANAYLGPCPDGMECHHKDNNPRNPSIFNLKYVTPSQNKQYSVQAGHKGVNRWNAVLNEDTVRRMRKMYDKGKGLSIQKIADYFGANFTTTYHVLMNHNWKHVE